MKSFIDGTVVPMLEFSDTLLDFSAQHSTIGRVLVGKRRQVASWSDRFRKSGKERIDMFIAKEMNELLAEIPAFAEDNYDRSNAGDRWNRLVKRQDLNRKAQKLAEQIGDECRNELSEIARQLKTELNFVGQFSGDRRISMDSIFDSKRAWNWATGLLSCGLTIAALFLGPLGWVAAAVGWVGRLLGPWLFEDKETKVRQQREQLESRLKRNVKKIERNLQKQLGDWFHQDLLKKQVSVLLYEFGDITSKLFKLADSQRNLAWKLNKHQKRPHRILIDKALGQLGHKDCGNLVLDIARVPGLAIMLLIEPNTTFPEDVHRDLEELLGEKVWFVINNNRNKVSILAQAIGLDCDPSKVRIESDIQVAHVPVDDLDAVGISRIRLAQQLTELHVEIKREDVTHENLRTSAMDRKGTGPAQ